MNFLKVSGHENLVRDMSSQAIVNTNIVEYSAYIKRREAALDEKKELIRLSGELNSIKTDVLEIKQMLNLLIKEK